MQLGLLAAVAALVAVAGCAAPQGPQGPEATGAEGAATSSASAPPADPAGPDVVLAGTVVPLRSGFVANVSAHNAGGRTLTFGQAYTCTGSGYGSWTARLAGPDGTEVDYSLPTAYEWSCSGTTGNPMPPASYANWTFYGDWETGTCTARHVCDNWWDGNVTGPDGARHRAPAGTYAWTFTFAYRTEDGPKESEAVSFQVQVAGP